MPLRDQVTRPVTARSRNFNYDQVSMAAEVSPNVGESAAEVRIHGAFS